MGRTHVVNANVSPPDGAIHDDSKWGGHAFENFILGVYNHGGLDVSIGNAVVYRGALLAILTTNSADGSGHVIESQQVVRVQTTPAPALQMLRCLAVPGISPYEIPWYIPCLFVHDTSLLLFAAPDAPDASQPFTKIKSAPQSQLDEIDVNARTLHIAAKVPVSMNPIGLANGHYFVLGLPLPPNIAGVSPVWLHDLRRHVTTPLSAAWKNGEYAKIYLPQSGFSMPYLAVQAADKIFVLHLPDGRQTSVLPVPRQTNSSVLLWNNLAVIVEPYLNRIAVYEAQTGRRVKTFAMEAGGKGGK